MTPSHQSRPSSPSKIDALFRFVIARRFWVIGFWAVVLVPAIYFATRVQQDNSIDRLIVQSDPDAVNARAFEKVFGSGEYVVLLAEAEDPYSPAVLKTVDELEKKLSALPRVSANSALTIFRRARAGFSATPEQAAEFKKFATGTDLFRKQGLVGPHFIGIPLVLAVHGTKERHDTVAAVDKLIAPYEQHPAPLTALRKVGQPYVNAYLDNDTRQAGMRYFPVFFLFVIALNYALYRSFRALAAFIITLAVSAATSVGYVGVTGGTFTIISALVPMTILITCTATLVYLHSRFVDCPPDRDVEDHRIFALHNKFLACTASMVATAVGFAALAVSEIRPIREMGVWVAVGIAITWLVVFTLFPALQKVLNTPTLQERQVAGKWFDRFTDRLPAFSYRYRWLLVPGSLLLCGVGAIAVFGLPGLIKPAKLETNALEYINHSSNLYQDTKHFEEAIGGLSITEVWLQSKDPNKVGVVTDSDVMKGLIDFTRALEKDPQVSAVIGLPTILRTLRYVSGQGDRLPTDPASLDQITGQLDTLLSKEPMLARFVEPKRMSQTHLSVITRMVDYQKFLTLDRAIKQAWAQSVKLDPALGQFDLKTVGLAPLQAKISYHLVPTLVESFGLTVIIIFGTFLLVFRNGAARLMAMIPSLFAILVMFVVMRLSSMSLNVATILIASTVLGTSENDQIHFFYHYLEKSKSASTEESLKHTLHISGRAIFFATLINAGGFLAFALADLPPMRQFGILSAVAFLLSMLADFTALPAALWLVFRDKPDALKRAEETPPSPDKKS
ncbi:MAG: RND family transporter [Polyangia bacterium]